MKFFRGDLCCWGDLNISGEMWGLPHWIEKNQALMFNERNLAPIDVSTISTHIF